MDTLQNLSNRVFRMRLRTRDIRNLIIGCRYQLDRSNPIFYDLLRMYKRIGWKRMRFGRGSFLTAKFTYADLKLVDQALQKEIPDSLIAARIRAYLDVFEGGRRVQPSYWRLIGRTWKGKNASWKQFRRDMRSQTGEAYHREFRFWGRLFNDDGEEVYEDLHPGRDDGWLYNEEGTKVKRSPKG